jgi:peptidoglycan/xylan/chitin deacetylase (PgdA/CDA1 family)
VGTAKYVSWSQVREMAEAGMNIGSHGREHVDYSTMAPELAHLELQRSRLAIEDATGRPVTAFSAPYGFVNRRVVASARAAGFERICSSLPWTARKASAVLPRLAVYRDTSLAEFARLAMGDAGVLIPRLARHAALYWPKQILLRTCPRRLGVQMREERA